MIVTIIFILTLVLGISIFIATHSYKFPPEPNKYTPQKYGFDFEEISIPTRNNKKLYGWWIHANNPKNEKLPTIILIHGWARNVDRMMSYIKKLHPQGYNLLAFDARCHGKSDDDDYSSMVKFKEDIIAAIDFAEQFPTTNGNRIGLLGLSMGGAASIYASSLDNRIKAVVTVGAFSHPEKVMGTEFKKHKIPYFPFVWLAFRYMELRIKKRFNAIAPVNNIGKSNANILLIHGKEDVVVPIEQALELKISGNSNLVELLQLADKGHSDCNHHPDFWPKVLAFFKSNL